TGSLKSSLATRDLGPVLPHPTYLSLNAYVPYPAWSITGFDNGTTDIARKNAATGASECLMSPNGGVGSSPAIPATRGWDVIATGNFNYGVFGSKTPDPDCLPSFTRRVGGREVEQQRARIAAAGTKNLTSKSPLKPRKFWAWYRCAHRGPR